MLLRRHKLANTLQDEHMLIFYFSAIIARSTDIEYYDNIKHNAIIVISTTCIINNDFDVIFTK